MHRVEFDIDLKGLGTVKVDGEVVKCSDFTVHAHVGQPTQVVITLPAAIGTVKVATEAVRYAVAEKPVR